MTCPRCHATMTEHTLGGHLGRAVVVDVCLPCQAFWFDGRESLQLTPASTLHLFELIGAQQTPIAGAAETAACPRCATPLRLTRDMQRNTRFEYWRCPAGHGRLTTFFNFLREKNFVRPLSGPELAELRANVASVNCSNCGAPVDLARGTACGHCRSPLSMLDMQHAQQVVAELRRAARPAVVDPTLPTVLEHVRRTVNADFDTFAQDRRYYDDARSGGLITAGLGALSRWLKGT